MNAKTLLPKRGEIGLAKFHHLIGIASFLAGIALMLASLTALYWFGGVIGMPKIARFAVAGAIEVMAASLASSATTARRETGKVDLSAWIGFAFFVSIAAYANIMHVIVSLTNKTTPIPGLPAGFVITPEFVIAACVFAAACPFGGTFGVHRFGWLRAHGADAEWTDTEDGIVVEQQDAPKPKPKPKAKRAPEPSAPPLATSAPSTASAPAARTSAPAPAAPAPTPAARVDVDQDARDPRTLTRAVYDEMVAEDSTTRPDAAEVRRRAGIVDKPHPATVRGWVKGWWEERAARASEPVDTRASEPLSTRAEVHLADPPDEDEIQDAPRARHSVTRIA